MLTKVKALLQKITQVLPAIVLLLGVAAVAVAGVALAVAFRVERSLSAAALAPVASAGTGAVLTATVSYSDMLAVYKEVLDTSRGAVESSHKMLGQMATWMTILIGVLTATGVGSIWLVWRSVGQVQERTEQLVGRLGKTGRQLAKQQDKADTLGSNLARMAERLDTVRKQAAEASRQLSLVPRLATLAEVDKYAMRLFSETRRTRLVAKAQLLELSKDPDPVVCRECIRVFGAMLDYPECFDLPDEDIVARLQGIAETTKERGVRLEAEAALRRLAI